MTLHRRLSIALGIAALVGVAAVQAAELHQVKVPFAFEAADQKLEAGIYIVSNDVGGEMLVRNSQTGRGVFFLPVAGGPTDQESSLTFRCYGTHCFLSKVQFGGIQMRYEVQPSKHEKEIALDEKPQITLVAMR
jgi:hypothetical protein